MHAKGSLECRAMLEKKIVAHEIMYGVNTGIGEFSEIVLNDDQIKDFQKYLVYNHAAGIGDPASIETVRGAMLGRINVMPTATPVAVLRSQRLMWRCSTRVSPPSPARKDRLAPAATLLRCRR